MEAAAEAFSRGPRQAPSVISFNPDFPAFVALLTTCARLGVEPRIREVLG
jgi:hypothetical protein